MKWLAIATAIGSLVACGGGSGGSSPTAPTPPVTNANIGGSGANIGGSNANIGGSYNATVTASSTCSANLPSETRVLGFMATITQTGAAVQVQLVSGGSTVTVSGTVSGQTVNFPSFSFSGNRDAALVWWRSLQWAMPTSPLTGRSQAPSAAHTRRHRDPAMPQTINFRWSAEAAVAASYSRLCAIAAYAHNPDPLSRRQDGGDRQPC